MRGRKKCSLHSLPGSLFGHSGPEGSVSRGQEFSTIPPRVTPFRHSGPGDWNRSIANPARYQEDHNYSCCGFVIFFDAFTLALASFLRGLCAKAYSTLLILNETPCGFVKTVVWRSAVCQSIFNHVAFE